MSNVRLIDVFILGPFQILVGISLKRKDLKAFFVLVGFFNILYNLHNYLYFDKKVLPSPIMPIDMASRGKTQIHRLYNILVMYPIMAYTLSTQRLPKYLQVFLVLDVVIGTLYNLYYFLKYI